MYKLTLASSYSALLSAALFVVATVVVAAPAPTATNLLERWRDALGGAQALKSIESVYSRSRVEAGGMTGVAESWATATGQTREVFDLGGVYKTVTVYDIDTGWTLDHNGKVQPLQGVSLAAQITNVYLSSYSHLLSGRRSGTVEHIGEDDTGENYKLKIMPDRGQPVTVYLDKTTFLPSRYDFPADDRMQSSYVSDWREIDGVKFPFHSRQTTGDPRYDVLIDVQEIKLNAPLTGKEFSQPEEAAKDYRFTAGAPARNIPFELNSNHIYVQATINGKGPLWFILDTGAGVTVLNADYAEALGLELQGRFEGRGAGEASTDVSVIKDASFTLPGIELMHQTIMAIPFTALEPYEGRRIDGVLGYDLISRFVMEIDYEHRLIHLYEPETYSYSGDGERFPIVLESNHPHLHVGLSVPGNPDLDAYLTIDTGARSALGLSSPFCNEHRLTAGITTISGAYGAGVGGETRQLLGRIPVLKVGEYRLENVIAGFSQDTSGALASRDDDGLFGGDILRRFTAIFDYSRNEMILSPNSHFGEPFEYDMSGMFLTSPTPDFKTFVVKRMVEVSPAAEAGLHEGDVITAIDGKSSAEYTLEQVREMFKQPGETHRLTIDREGESLEFVIKLRRLI